MSKGGRARIPTGGCDLGRWRRGRMVLEGSRTRVLLRELVLRLAPGAPGSLRPTVRRTGPTFAGLVSRYRGASGSRGMRLKSTLAGVLIGVLTAASCGGSGRKTEGGAPATSSSSTTTGDGGSGTAAPGDGKNTPKRDCHAVSSTTVCSTYQTSGAIAESGRSNTSNFPGSQACNATMFMSPVNPQALQIVITGTPDGKPRMRIDIKIDPYPGAGTFDAMNVLTVKELDERHLPVAWFRPSSGSVIIDSGGGGSVSAKNLTSSDGRVVDVEAAWSCADPPLNDHRPPPIVDPRQTGE